MSKCDKDHTYNGWPNYETWCASLWMDNYEGTYRHARSLAKGAKRDFASNAEEHDEDGCALNCGRSGAECPYLRRPASVLADALKEMFEESAPDIGASFYADMLSAAMSVVDWQCIAEHILSE